MKITVTIHTASLDDFLSDQGIKSYFSSVLTNLKRQTFKDFELIYIDTFHETNKDNFAALTKGLPFQVKHVPIHKDHRYWYDKGNTYISAAKNTGILYADGELIISFDDGEYYPDDLLQRYWQYYQGGCYMHAAHRRMKSIETKDGDVSYPISGDIYINDHRYNHEVQCHQNGVWTYAGTSFSLSDALTLNGFNEKMDAYKSLEDCDFGIRLTLIGRKFMLDPEGCVFIVDHKSYVDDPRRKKINEYIAIENYGVLRASQDLNRPEANKYPIKPDELEIIKRETLYYRKFDPLAPENAEKLKVWIENPTFDLTSQRKLLRESSDWKW